MASPTSLFPSSPVSFSGSKVFVPSKADYLPVPGQVEQRDFGSIRQSSSSLSATLSGSQGQESISPLQLMPPQPSFTAFPQPVRQSVVSIVPKDVPSEADDKSLKLAWPAIRAAIKTSEVSARIRESVPLDDAEPTAIRKWAEQPIIWSKLAWGDLVLNIDRRGGLSFVPKNMASRADDESLKVAWPAIRNAIKASEVADCIKHSAPPDTAEPAAIRKWSKQPIVWLNLAWGVLTLDMDRKGGPSLKKLPRFLIIFKNLRLLSLANHDKLKRRVTVLNGLKYLELINLKGTNVRRGLLSDRLDLIAVKESAEETMSKMTAYIKSEKEALIQNGLEIVGVELMKRHNGAIQIKEIPYKPAKAKDPVGETEIEMRLISKGLLLEPVVSADG